MDTEPLAALPPLSLPFSAAVDEAVVAAGSMFCEAMTANGAGDRQTGGETDQASAAQTHRHTAL